MLFNIQFAAIFLACLTSGALAQLQVAGSTFMVDNGKSAAAPAVAPASSSNPAYRGGSKSEFSFTGARCAPINGNCDANGCAGTRDSPYCSKGNWAGCPCGFGCAPQNGPCNGGCKGVPSGRKPGDGVCTVGPNVGCSCNL